MSYTVQICGKAPISSASPKNYTIEVSHSLKFDFFDVYEWKGEQLIVSGISEIH